MYTNNRSWLIVTALGLLLLLLLSGCGSAKIKVKTTPPPALQTPNTAEHTPAVRTTTQQQAPNAAEHSPAANHAAPPGH